MTGLLYHIVLLLIDGYIRVAAIFNLKAKRFTAGRSKTWAVIDRELKGVNSRVLWFHCASVGEYEQAVPLIEAMRSLNSDDKIVVTFFSPSGYEAIKTGHLIDYKYYLPLDYRANAKRFVELVKPYQVFFIKYEFWYNYLKYLHRAGIPVYSVSAIFRKSQPFFKWYGGFHRRMLSRFKRFFVQDRTSQELLSGLGINSVVTGDTRFDRVIDLKSHSLSLPILDDFVGNSTIMVIGSMRKEDESLLTSFILSQANIKFILAPHEINEKHIVELQQNLVSSVRYSIYKPDKQKVQVLIIDNIGMLSQLYRYGHYAYVGGGFSDGLHNILEPAVHEIPIFFGNRQYDRFKEAIDLIDLGAAFPVGSLGEMTRVFEDLQADAERYRVIQASVHQYVEANQGAAAKIISALNTPR
jgi:3-deoxy-D-manno-octulosonic-acid transferase